MYQYSVPVLVHSLKALSAVLRRAEAHCDAKKIDKAVLLGCRLFPDMFPLVRQAQLVTDFAKGCGARLAGIAVPSYADEEKTFDELQARIAKTIAFLNGLDVKLFDGAADRAITLKVAGQETTMSGTNYLNSYALPNFYFHYTTAYNLLRHNGVELGKMDFVGRRPA
jgi:uncharacterized protein